MLFFFVFSKPFYEGHRFLIWATWTIVTLSLSSTKRTSLYHDSCFFVFDSLPPGNPNLSLCSLSVWLTEWCAFMSLWSNFQTDELHFVIWHLHPSIQMPHCWKFAWEWRFTFLKPHTAVVNARILKKGEDVCINFSYTSAEAHTNNTLSKDKPQLNMLITLL